MFLGLTDALQPEEQRTSRP